MNSNFIVNDYIIIWNLLFGASISEDIHNLKQKIWNTYKEEYNKILKDKEIILKDYKNFIPNDDTVYNIVLDTDCYEKYKKKIEKYRVELMKIWDKNKKETSYLFKNIIKNKISDCTFFVVNKELNILEYTKENSMIIGKEIDLKNEKKILIDITVMIINSNIKKYEGEYKKFKDAILELAIINEYQTRITNNNCYNCGNTELKTLKMWLYPYWLMYLGIPKEDFSKRMIQDGIAFDADKYAYEKELKKMTIEEFIEFCTRNQRYIIRQQKEKQELNEII